jgi:hypothetical protein
VRFRRCKGSIIPNQHPALNTPGRPKKEEGEAAYKLIRINGKVLNIILDYRNADSDETYNDTILRIWNCKTQIILEQSEKIKELEQENKQLKEKLHNFS